MKPKSKSALSTDALTRFANNTIHQNVAEQTLASPCARSSTAAPLAPPPTRPTKIRCAGWSRRPLRSPAASRRIPGCCPCPARKNTRRSRAITSPPLRPRRKTAPAPSPAFARWRTAHRQIAAGIFSSGSVHQILANSRGLFAQHQQTRAEFSVTILEEDSSGWAKANSPDILRLDPEALAESASLKAAQTRAPREVASRPLDRDSRTRRCARSGGLSFLRFCRNCSAGPALLFQRAAWAKK